MEKRYPISQCHGWATLILFYYSSDETAFDKFYEFLDDFKKQKELDK